MLCGVVEAPRGSEKSQFEVSPARRRVRLSPSPSPSRSVSVLMARLRSVLFDEVVVDVEEAPVVPGPEWADTVGVVEEGGG